jgi:acyl-CoA oxidase
MTSFVFFTLIQDVHMAMFIPALEFQTSEAQKAKWLPLAKSFRILGAYVQTELGHGSNVQALETTATFDSSIDGFVLHTPSLSATKW